MYRYLNYESNKTTVLDFLLHKTEIGDIVWIRDGGYHHDIVYIDGEDLFVRPQKYGVETVKSARVVGTYVFINEYDKNIHTGAYIELELSE